MSARIAAHPECNPIDLRSPIMRTTRHTVTVHDSQYDSTIRLSLGEPHYGSVDGGLARDAEIGTGVFARALWVGRRHVVLLSYSQWVGRDGTCTGDTYRRCDAEDVTMIRRLYGAEAAERVLDALRVPVTETICAVRIAAGIDVAEVQP